jgi:hypothetical protein
MGGCEEGEGKGTKMYGVVGMTDGPGCVSTLMPVDVVVADAEVGVLEEVSDDEDEGEVELPEWDEPRDELEGNDGCDCDGGIMVVMNKRGDGDDAPGWAEGEDEGDDDDDDEAKVYPAPRRTSKTEGSMGVLRWGGDYGRTGKGEDGWG